MRVTLVHNPEAGFGSPSADELMAWLVDAGYEPTYQSTQSADFARTMGAATDLVIAAGGDGTVATVMRRLAGGATPMAILPHGTANNIATSLGIGGNARATIAAMADARRLAFDVALAVAPWGTSRFVESAGVGLFARVLKDAWRDETNTNEDAGARDLVEGRGERMRRLLATEPVAHRFVEADGVDLSGAYVFVAALNIPYIGPRLALAPGADPADGQFELLVVREDDRPAMDSFLVTLSEAGDARLPAPTRRCRQVRLRWEIGAGHLDDEPWPDAVTPLEPAASSSPVTLIAGDTTVDVLVPRG